MIHSLDGVLLKEILEHECQNTEYSQPRGCRGKTGNISRSILLGPKPSRIDRGSVADRVDERDCNSSLLCRLWDDIADPRLDQW